MPSLPQHFALGRGAFSGPVIGGYNTFGGGPKSLTAGGTGTDEVWFGFKAPCDMRVHRIQWTSRARVAALTAKFHKNATYDLTGSTNMIAATSVSLAAADSGFIETATGGDSTLVAAARDVLKGEFVMCAITFDATGAATDLLVHWFVQITGHPNAEASND